MPYRDIKLSLLNNKKLKINPGSIVGMIEFADVTSITTFKSIKFYPGWISVKEKIKDILKLIEPISKEEYFKNKGYSGLKPDCVIFDELKKDIKKQFEKSIPELKGRVYIENEFTPEKQEKLFFESAQRIYKSLGLKMDKKDKKYHKDMAKKMANI